TVPLEDYPESLSYEELAQRAGYAQDGAFDNPRAHLCSLSLLTYTPRGGTRAAAGRSPGGSRDKDFDGRSPATAVSRTEMRKVLVWLPTGPEGRQCGSRLCSSLNWRISYGLPRQGSEGRAIACGLAKGPGFAP